MLLSERIEILILYYQNGETAGGALDAYRKKHKTKTATGPWSRAAVGNLVRKFETSGSVHDAPRRRSARLVAQRTNQIQEEVHTVAQAAPRGESSVRDISRRTGIPITTVWRTMRYELKLYPFKMQHVQELQPGDYQRRLEWAEYLLWAMEVDADYTKKILWTDEASFYLNGHVNTKNCVIWSQENPHATYQTPVRSKKVTVWCGFTSNFIIGPYFFEERVGGNFFV